MPSTKFESVVFTLIMVFCMVFCMTSYSIYLNVGELNDDVFSSAIKGMWLEYVIVFMLAFFVVTNLAKKLTFRILNPKEDNGIHIMLAMQCFTVAIMVPTVTLIATFIHGGITQDWFYTWIKTAFRSFPVALVLQVLYIGPLVRLIFRSIFRRKAH